MRHRITLEKTGVDRTAVFRLYAAVRSAELEMHRWEPELRDSILRLQFDARAQAYTEHFPGAAEWLIVRDGLPVGWLILDRRRELIHCIDIAIIPAERGKGIATEVFRSIQEEAAAGNIAVALTVLRDNIPALALYEKLGFKVTEKDDLHIMMEWRRE